MAHNEEMTVRVRAALAHLPAVEEKKMFRGVAFMVDGKLCLGTGNDELLCRIDPALFEEAVEWPGIRPMTRGNQTMKGYVYVQEDILRNQKEFDFWIGQALQFNSKAKASKKQKKT